MITVDRCDMVTVAIILSSRKLRVAVERIRKRTDVGHHVNYTVDFRSGVMPV